MQKNANHLARNLEEICDNNFNSNYCFVTVCNLLACFLHFPAFNFSHKIEVSHFYMFLHRVLCYKIRVHFLKSIFLAFVSFLCCPERGTARPHNAMTYDIFVYTCATKRAVYIQSQPVFIINVHVCRGVHRAIATFVVAAGSNATLLAASNFKQPCGKKMW